MLIRMAIADRNEEYTERLRSVLEEHEDLELFVYTEEAALERALAARHFDILLFDESAYDGKSMPDKSTVPIMLLDEEQPVPEHLRNCAKVRKYQHIENIYKQCINYYADIRQTQGVNILGNRNVSCLAFYSPAGGVGKTTLALTAALTLARRHYQVFYLNLEDFASEECFLPQGEEKGISELAACLGTNIDVNLKIRALLKVKENGLCYMNHFDSPNDIVELSDEEIGGLLDMFLRSGLFDYVIVDLGCSMDEKTRKVFEFAKKIVVVERPDAMAMAKMRSFFRQTHILNDYAGKMVRVSNFDSAREAALDTGVPKVARIGAFQNPDSAQLVEILANGGAGDFVNQIM